MSNKLAAETPGLEEVSKSSIWGALISRTLPSYHGPLPVGVCDLELPVPPETFGTFLHTSFGKGSPAGLSLDTVFYSIFYPTTDEPTDKKAVYFPKWV
jgi:platelet-activating factor acetylhydrolase